MTPEIKEILEKLKADGRIYSYVFDHRMGDLYIGLCPKVEFILDYEKLLEFKHKEAHIISMINQGITNRFCELADLSRKFNSRA